MKTGIKWGVIALAVAGFFTTTPVMSTSVIWGTHAFQHDWELGKVISIAVMLVWVSIACGAAWAKTDWKPKLGADIQGEIQDFTGGAVHGNPPPKPGEKNRPDFGDVFKYYWMTLRVYFVNHANVPVSIKGFGLEIKDSEREYLAFSEPGEIRQFDAAQMMETERPLLNLHDKIGVQATQWLAFEGYLRFEFSEMKELRPEAKMTLIVRDARNDNHRITAHEYVRPKDRLIINLPEKNERER